MTTSETSSPPNQSTAEIVLRNTTFITIGMVVLKLVNFFYNIYVVRSLGDNRMGQYSTVLAFVGVLQIFAELGVTQFVNREIARDRSKVSTYFWNLVAIRGLLGLIAIGVIPLLGRLYGYQGDVLLGIGIYATSFVVAAFSAPLSMVLNSHEKLGALTIVSVVTQVVTMLLGSIALLSGLGFLWLVGISLIGLLTSAVFSVIFIRRAGIHGFKLHFEPAVWLHLIRAGLPFGIVSLMLSISFSIDTVMLSKFVSSEEVGWYGVAYNLIFTIVTFMGGFKQAIEPTLSRVFARDVNEVKVWYKATIKFIILFSFPLAIGGFLLAFPIIRYLYTDEFLPSGLALQILIWDVPLLLYTSFAGNMTTISNQERAAARINSVNVLANVSLNLLFIPRFGLVGAAIVTVLTDLISALQFYMLFNRSMKPPAVGSMILRAGAAAMLMGGLVYALRDALPFYVVIALGAVLYTGLVILLRLVGKAEWNQARRGLAMVFKRRKAAG